MSSTDIFSSRTKELGKVMSLISLAWVNGMWLDKKIIIKSGEPIDLAHWARSRPRELQAGGRFAILCAGAVSAVTSVGRQNYPLLLVITGIAGPSAYAAGLPIRLSP